MCRRLTNSILNHADTAERRMPKRKRVSFGEEDSSKRQIIEFRPLSRELPAEEKTLRWLQPSDRRAIRSASEADARECLTADYNKIMSGKSQLAFSETYTNMYAICHLQSTDEKESPLSFMSLEEVQSLGFSCARGLEDRIAPTIAIQRRLARINAIRTVVAAQRQCNDNPEFLKLISETMTTPAKKMGEALGFADAAAVYFESFSERRSDSSHSTVEGSRTVLCLPEVNAKDGSRACELLATTS